MAVTIDSTVGGASANSFVSLADAQTYIDGKFPAPASWTAATTDTKNRALVSATRWLSALPWDGKKTAATQALQWPRLEVVDIDDPDGLDYDSDALPQRVVDATCELAIEFVKGGTTDIAGTDPLAGVIRKRTDVLETEWAPHLRRDGLQRYPTAYRLIAPLLATASGAGFAIERG